MPRITQYYNILEPVPFVDVELTKDTKQFVDPHAVRLGYGFPDVRVEAVRGLDTFFGTILECVLADTTASRERGRLLLQRFREPWETRLGVSRYGYHGRGGAEDIGTGIWDACTGDVRVLIELGVLKRVEHLPMFVAGIDRDITSDITTRIVFSALAKFTCQMVQRYPQFEARVGGAPREFHCQMWDADEGDWATRSSVLPAPDGKPLLLVPAGWARGDLLMSATRFYETQVLSFVQLKRMVLDARGKAIRTPKRMLRKQPSLGPGRNTIRRLTIEAIDDGDDLVAAFEAFVAGRFDEPGDEPGSGALLAA